MSQNTYPRCKYNTTDGRIATIQENEEPFFPAPEWVNSPADVPPPPVRPAEGCPNCLALVADIEAKTLKFDTSWLELTETNRNLLEESAALRIQADKLKATAEVNTKLSAENAKLRAQIQKLAEKAKAEKAA